MIKLLNKEWLNHAEKRHEKRVDNMMRLADESRKSRFKRCMVNGLKRYPNGNLSKTIDEFDNMFDERSKK